jgi:DNA-directed RNA polymerase subunit RPC12/RpoP
MAKKTIAIACPNCGSPNSDWVVEAIYKCRNCETEFVFKFENKLNVSLTATDANRQTYDEFSPEKLKESRRKDLKFTLIILGIVLFGIGFFIILGLRSHNWRF